MVVSQSCNFTHVHPDLVAQLPVTSMQTGLRVPRSQWTAARLDPCASRRNSVSRCARPDMAPGALFRSDSACLELGPSRASHVSFSLLPYLAPH